MAHSLPATDPLGRAKVTLFRRAFPGLLMLFIWWSLSATAGAQVTDQQCGGLRDDILSREGPYDYRVNRVPEPWRQSRQDLLENVERNHFPPLTEALIKPVFSSFGADISYTLNVFPNHHRALASLMRLADRQKTTKVSGAKYSVECYFNRATRFAPEDTVVRGLYASFLIAAGRTSDAKWQLEKMEEHASGSAMTFYNLGMLYADIGQFDIALTHAHTAMRLGLGPNFPVLQRRLETAGQWRPPEATGSNGRSGAAGHQAP
jgi:hypothetical protein